MVKPKIFLFLVIYFLINTVLSQEIARVENVKIDSKALGQKREILIFTPQSYDESPFAYYNVIYVFDAQNREFFGLTYSIASFLSDNSKQFIVVGITSPYFEETDYARNNDMLPKPKNIEPKKFFNGYSGNADNFLNYVKNEVVPYIDSNYRTLPHRTAVGHSLSASFIIYSMLNEPGLFNNYIAISPNFAYDKESLVDGLYHFDFGKNQSTTYLFLSNANEGIGFWPEWKPAREKVYHLLQDSIKQDNLYVVIKEYPEETHWNTFLPGIKDGLQNYFNTVYDIQQNELSGRFFPVTIRVKVPGKNDEVYITGNQANLANWDPGKIKMEGKPGFEREITLQLQSPAQLKFTRGTWETEAVVKGNPQLENITIKPEKQQDEFFEIIDWVDNWK